MVSEAGGDTAPGAQRLSGPALLMAAWGVLGVLAILGQAIFRLGALALEPLRDGSVLTGGQIALYIGWTVFNAYAEGYRGFQRAFSPRVVARAVHLGRHPTPLRVLLAPLYCMALFGATRRRLIVAWVMLGGIALLVTLVRQLPQPWRGIVDAGVVVGLLWGVVVIVWLFARAVVQGRVPADDSIPEKAR